MHNFKMAYLAFLRTLQPRAFLNKPLLIHGPLHTHHTWFQMTFYININYSLKGQIFAIINYIYRNMLLVLEALPKVLLGHCHCHSPGIKQCARGSLLRHTTFLLNVPILEHFLKYQYCFCLCPQLSGGPRLT